MPFSFARSILNQAENTAFDLTTKEINNMLSSANAQLTDIYLKQAPTAKEQQALSSSIKLLKDVLVLIVRVCGHFMESLESLKSERECTDSFSKMILVLTNIFTYFIVLFRKTTPLLLKAFEFFDKTSKPGCKEFAHTCHDALREATRTIPLTRVRAQTLSNKSRPATSAEKSATGLLVQEEAFDLIEKLYKSYLKPEINS
jgi:hypothetical protein